MKKLITIIVLSFITSTCYGAEKSQKELELAQMKAQTHQLQLEIRAEKKENAHQKKLVKAQAAADKANAKLASLK